MSHHHFNGTLLVDSAQMLLERDLPLPPQWQVTTEGWYPAETYEEIANAWLHLIAAGNTESFKLLGAKSADRLLSLYPQLVQPGDLRESLIRFLAIRQCLYDFPAVDVIGVGEHELALKLDFELQPKAEQAAAFHIAGFLARLLELGGAQDTEVKLVKRSWEDEGETRLEATWRAPLN